MIPVSRPFLPPMEEYTALLATSWEQAWLTNNGPLAIELEKKLRDFLGVKYVLVCSNGTIALELALRSLGISGGEIITTPFSYIATTNAILFAGGTPVYADIEPETCSADPATLEQLITEKTKAILITHVFGFPAAIDQIQQIADKYNLKILFDGAHAFGCTFQSRSLLSFGDVTTCSFHATKIFHTAEGGCVITNNDSLAEQIVFMRQNGHRGDEYRMAGTNAKLSELHAALGLCNLRYFQKLVRERKVLWERYSKELTGLNVHLFHPFDGYNYVYYPVLFPSQEILLQVIELLRKHQIQIRRYFYPSLQNLTFTGKGHCPVSTNISSRIACLPLFNGLTKDVQHFICQQIKEVFKMQAV